MYKFDSSYWALILGGSSGFGLATAHKLSDHGMNIAVVHRDRQGSMPRIQTEFDLISQKGVQLEAFNVDALSSEGIGEVLNTLEKKFAGQGKIRLLLHSIAFGNLKLLAPDITVPSSSGIEKLSKQLGLDSKAMQNAVNTLFSEGEDAFVNLASPTQLSPDSLLEDEDWARTVAAMGTSLASWAQQVLTRKLFTQDARILGLTSEGNRIAWRGYAAVAAAKAALESISRALAVEFAPYGVRANIIQAGVTLTPALKLIPGFQQMMAKSKLRNPYQRLTTPQDVANFIYLMSLDEAEWVNGNIICVDGGEHIGG